jgi:hypothetical protein
LFNGVVRIGGVRDGEGAHAEDSTFGRASDNRTTVSSPG